MHFWPLALAESAQAAIEYAAILVLHPLLSPQPAPPGGPGESANRSMGQWV